MRVQLPLRLTVSAALGIALLGSAPQASATSVSTTTTLAVTSGASAATTVTSGSVVTLTATVLAGTTPITVGQVNFCNAAATYCTDINLLATAQLTSAGTAVFKFRPGVGSHSYKAVFVGTPNGATAYAGSASSAAALTMTGLWPSITTVALGPAEAGYAYTVTATVGGNASVAPTGSLSILGYNNSLDTPTLGAGTAGIAFLDTWNAGTGDVSSVAGVSSIAVGDFNGDGIPDLALAGDASGTLTVLLGNGDGTFTATSTGPDAGKSPYTIAAGDFNGDGILDLAVTTESDSTVTIILGNGDGTFTPVAASSSAGSQPNSIAVGDFNGDGITDLAVVNGSGTVSILLGNGDGTFTPTPASPATGSNPVSIAAGDFNGDGNLDLAVANILGGTVTILLGNGKGNFTPVATSPVVGTYPDSIAVGDFNGDGNLDLAVANECGDDPSCESGGEVMILMGNGNGTFTASTTIPFTNTEPRSVVVGDFNGDGIPDLATANETDNAVSVLLGDGTGHFTAAVSPYANSNEGSSYLAAVGDFNGDGIPDLAVSLGNSFYGYSDVAILETANQTATATVGGAGPVPTWGTEFALASYAGDTNYLPSTSSAGPPEAETILTVTVTPTSSSITTVQALTVTVVVIPPQSGPFDDTMPGGTVRLTSGSYNSGAIALNSGAPNTSAQINIPAGSLAPGSDTLTAVYTPNSSSSQTFTSTSGTGTVTVSLYTPTVTVTPVSSTILATQTLQVNVSVSGSSGSPTPTGSVALTSGSYSSGAVTLSGGNAQINIPGGSLATGNDTLTVSYTPDSSSSAIYGGASGTGTVVVSSFTPTVTVTPLSTSILTTQALQVNVSVSGSSGDPTPTGTAELTGGGYDSGAITLSGGSVAINIPAGSLSPGADTLTVSYTPDLASIANYSSATGSSTVTVTAPNPSPVIGSISPAIETAGDAAFTLTVNGSGFISGSTVYWGATALTTQFVSGVQVTATVPASDIADSGTDSITVQNPSPGGGTSNILQFEVDSSGAGSPSFTATTATVTAGQSATYTVTLPTSSTAVTESCLNLPTGAACSYSSTANTVTITTSTTTPSATYQVTVVFTETVAGAASSFIFLPIVLLPLLRARKKFAAGRIWFTACLGIVLLIASASIGCGGGSGNTGPPPTHQITTSGVVTLTVQ